MKNLNIAIVFAIVAILLFNVALRDYFTEGIVDYIALSGYFGCVIVSYILQYKYEQSKKQ